MLLHTARWDCCHWVAHSRPVSHLDFHTPAHEHPLVVQVHLKIKLFIFMVEILPFLTNHLTNWITNKMSNWLSNWLADCLKNQLTNWLTDWLHSLISNQPANSMELTSFETTIPSNSKEISFILWNMEVHYHVQNHLSLSSVRLIQLMPSHPIHLQSISILYPYLCQGLLSGLFLSHSLPRHISPTLHHILSPLNYAKYISSHIFSLTVIVC
jgi:hypothetical protein